MFNFNRLKIIKINLNTEALINFIHRIRLWYWWIRWIKIVENKTKGKNSKLIVDCITN
jgi:hypothetical protein